MKKFTVLFFPMLLILIFSGLTSAQIKIGLGGGLTSIQSPDAYKNDVASGGEGFTGNYHLTAIAKLSLPLIPFTPAAFIDYHVLRGSGNRGSYAVETSMNILSIGLEGELTLLPIPVLSPYVCADFALNKFGQLEETSQLGSIVQSGVSRYGVGIGVGAVLTVLPKIDIDGSIKYQLLNLIGKNSGESNINALTLNIILLF